MKINHETQRTPYDCGVACVAMISDIPYEKIKEQHGKEGMRCEELDEILAWCGIKFERQMYNHLAPEEVYIVVVPSLNVQGGTHYIVIDTREESLQEADGYDPDKELPEGADMWLSCFDPNTGREGALSYGFDVKLQSWMSVVRIIM